MSAQAGDADVVAWLPIATAPRGVLVEVRMSDDETDVAEWRETRQCMLGPRAGERGPGWVSKENWLPIDEPKEWRAALPKTATEGG